MEAPRVFLQTTSNGIFSYHHGYENVSDMDLMVLLELTHTTLISLETEKRKRQVTTHSETLVKFIKTLNSNLDKIYSLERVDNSGQILNAIETIKSPPHPNAGFRRYQQFFIDIMRLQNRGLFVLCAATLGKEKVRTMNKNSRVEVLGYLKANKSLFECRILDDLATQYGVPDYNELSSAGLHNVANQQQGKRPLSQADITSGESQFPHKRIEKDVIEDKRTLDVATSSADIAPNLQHRQIEYRFSEARVKSISLLGNDLADAVKSSRQWLWERMVGEDGVTDCVNALAPKDRNLDISLTLLVGFEKGTKLIEKLQLVPR